MNLWATKKKEVIIACALVLFVLLCIFVGINFLPKNKNTGMATGSNAESLPVESEYTGDVKKVDGLDSVLETDENGDVVFETQEIGVNLDDITYAADENTDNLGNGEAALDETIALEGDAAQYTEDSLSDEQKEKAFIDEFNENNAELRDGEPENAAEYSDMDYPEASELPTQQNVEADSDNADAVINSMRERDRMQAEMGLREMEADNQ